MIPYAIQIAYPGINNEKEFQNTLIELKKMGYSGIELNIEDFCAPPPGRLKTYLDDSGLILYAVATGKYAKAHCLSLTSPKKEIRLKSIDACRNMIEYAHNFNANIILGYIKGTPYDAGENAEPYIAEGLCALKENAGFLHMPKYRINNAGRH